MTTDPTEPAPRPDDRPPLKFRSWVLGAADPAPITSWEDFHREWKKTPEGAHPEAMPPGLPADLPPGLWSPPGPRAPTDRWQRWLESCRRRAGSQPNNQALQRLVEIAQDALAYRKTAPPHMVCWPT